MLLDLQMPGMSGIEALEQIRESGSTANIPVLVLSGHATVTDATRVIEKGRKFVGVNPQFYHSTGDSIGNGI